MGKTVESGLVDVERVATHRQQRGERIGAALSISYLLPCCRRLMDSIQTLAVLIALVACIPATTAVAQTVPADFDHYSTGFPLTGAHQAVPCQSCHLNGVLAGTPKLCSGCHNGTTAAGKSPNHVQTTAQCDACHTTTGASFQITGNFSHTGITAGCSECHAKDFPSVHIPTPSGSDCGLCHRPTPFTFSNAPSFDHANVTSIRCEVCHSGTFDSAGAVGKPNDHPTVKPGQDCGECHTTTAFVGSAFDHTGITTGCNNCHSKDKAADHIPVPAGSECVLCHNVAPDTFNNAASYSHELVTAMRCDSCHDGSHEGSGATGKSPNHPGTPPGMDCGACHTTTTFAGATAGFDHTNITTGCNNCHAREKTSLHIPVPAGSECVLCHQVAPDTFLNAVLFSHDKVSALRCDGCHDGSHTAYGANGKGPTHPTTPAGSDCGTCHSTRTFAGPGGLIFDHTTVTTGCSNCHASDKPANHIAVPAGAECILCHQVSPDTFYNAVLFNHSKVPSIRCDRCHDGAHVNYGALGKGFAHRPVPAGMDCGTCHSTTAFVGVAGLIFDHSIITTGCSTCHAVDKLPRHLPVPTGAECVLCHRVPPDLWTIANAFSHTNVSRMRCDSCHNGSYDSYGATSKSARHRTTPAGMDCGTCHGTTAFVGVGALVFDHTFVSSGCNGCHASDKPATHLPIPLNSECILCHRVPPDSFLTAVTFSHTSVTKMRCDSCHNGSYVSYGAFGKSPTHRPIPAGSDCGSCHTPSATFAVANFDHTSVTSGCNNCHLLNKPANHLPVPTGSECVACHRVAPDVFLNAANFSHTIVATMRCDTCHNGTYDAYRAIGKSTTHIPVVTNQDCKACHRAPPETFLLASNFNHTLVSTMRCDSCHNGLYTASGALGKTLSHVPTLAGQDCKACHTNTLTFIGGAFNHAGVISGCNTCHLTSKPATHLPVPTGSECLLCHRPPPDLFTIALNFNHTRLTGMRCESCHNGVYASYGAFGKTPNHVATQPGQDCNACHLSTISFLGAVFSHTGIVTGCNNCHAAAKPTNHLPTPAGSECVLCHRVAPDTWFLARNFTHSVVTNIRCDACHSGAYTAYNALSKSAAHLPMPIGADCGLCHRVSPEPFTLANNFNHINVASMRCDTCHSGAYTAYGALGKTPNHVATRAGQDCKVCHLNTISFLGAIYDHTGIVSGCSSCHAADKPANHLPVPAGSECILCHRVSPDTWLVANNFNHTIVATIRCDTCHNGAYTTYNAQGKSAGHLPMPAGADCGLCHRVSPDPFTLAGNFNHSNVTSMRCDTCHNGAYTTYGALGKTPTHPATSAGQDCNVCHLNTVTFLGAVYDHTGVTTGCNNCHAVNKPAGHLPVPAGSQCILCHRVPPDTWLLAGNWSHSKVTGLRCDGCHNGAYTAYGAIGKPAGHEPIPAGADCNASGCHTSTTVW